MPNNMSHCRFENTLADLYDCQEQMQNGDKTELNSYEFKAREKLLSLCIDIAEEFGHERDVCIKYDVNYFT